MSELKYVRSHFCSFLPKLRKMSELESVRIIILRGLNLNTDKYKFGKMTSVKEKGKRRLQLWIFDDLLLFKGSIITSFDLFTSGIYIL